MKLDLVRRGRDLESRRVVMRDELRQILTVAGAPLQPSGSSDVAQGPRRARKLLVGNIADEGVPAGIPTSPSRDAIVQPPYELARSN